jgi:hypothetical protein
VTEAEWRASDKPARMRSGINGQPDSQRRWVFFDLACIDRVQDLIDDYACLECIRAVASAVEQQQPPPQWYMLGQSAADSAIRKMWSRRTDPLREARIAALRAVSRLASHTLATSDMVCVAVGRRVGQPGLEAAVRAERKLHADFLRCVFQSPLNAVVIDPACRLARQCHLRKGCTIRGTSAQCRF